MRVTWVAMRLLGVLGVQRTMWPIVRFAIDVLRGQSRSLARVVSAVPMGASLLPTECCCLAAPGACPGHPSPSTRLRTPHHPRIHARSIHPRRPQAPPPPPTHP